MLLRVPQSFTTASSDRVGMPAYELGEIWELTTSLLLTFHRHVLFTI